MNALRDALCLILIPALLAAQPETSPLSPSVKELLRKPQLGEASLTRNDGTVLNGRVVRVTDRFVTLKSGPTCENVEVSSVAEIKAVQTKQPFKMADLGGGIAFLLLAPVWLVAWLLSLSPGAQDPLLGEWQSVLPSPDGSFARILIGNGIRRKHVFIRNGRYQIQDQQLLLKFEPLRGGIASEQALPFRFVCPGMVLDELLLTPVGAPLRPARAPIVGRWFSTTFAWEFRPDGSFQRETLSQNDAENGAFLRQGDGIHVQFRVNSRPGHEEDWKIRTKARHLWITRNGETTEYRRMAGF
jgi:hypothetical protein